VVDTETWRNNLTEENLTKKEKQKSTGILQDGIFDHKFICTLG